MKNRIVIIPVLAVLALLFFGCTQTQQQPAEQGQQNESTSPVAAFTLAQIADHNTAQDCWTTIDGNVYNVTAYIEKHPGGVPNITKACGVDATEMFAMKPTGRPHSENAHQLLATFYIGELKTN